MLFKNKNLERQLSRYKILSVRRSHVDDAQKACEASRQSVSKSPFKVRALGGGAWSGRIGFVFFSKPLKGSEEIVPFTCNVNSPPTNEN